MKKILLLLLSTSVVTLLWSQPVMENHVPPLGATYGLAQITSKITKATTGADQIWDYSGATVQGLASYTVIDPSTLIAKIKDSVPTATWGVRMELGAPVDKAPYDFFQDKTTFYQKVGTKNSGGGAVQKTTDTTMMFGQNYNTTLSYGGMTCKYVGYGTLKVKTKTYSNIVMLKSYYTNGSTDTLVQFHQFNPYYQLILSYAIMADTIANVIYFETLGGGTTGLSQQNKMNESLVFPNPAHDQITIRLADLHSCKQVIVRDIQGRMILDHSVPSSVIGDITISLDEIPVGLYFVSVNTGNTWQTHKLLIQ